LNTDSDQSLPFAARSLGVATIMFRPFFDQGSSGPREDGVHLLDDVTTSIVATKIGKNWD